MANIVDFLTQWFESSIAGSSIWSAIGFAAAALIGLYVFWLILRVVFLLSRRVMQFFAARRRKTEQGYGISLVPFTGTGGAKQSRELFTALQTHLDKFTFGAPFELIKATPLRAKGAKGLRSAATKWLETSASDLIIWGHRPRGRDSGVKAEILSLEGSLSPAEATHSVGLLPHIRTANRDIVGLVNAYLIARSLLPGLANATAYKAERIAPVAEILLKCLNEEDTLPERTLQTLEIDYCAMGLHLGEAHHLDNVIKLRRARLQTLDEAGVNLPMDMEIQARVDLGRALLKSSAIKFDPVLVREAVDQLKTAIELLKTNPILQLASVTSASVQQGQSLLANRKRFSVTGGANL